jgi:hypothetical protein
MILIMGRTRRIDDQAKRTTVALTPIQQLAVQELQVKRQKEGERKPLFNEVIIEGLEELLRKEGRSRTDLARIFPKQEARKAKVQTIRQRA